MLKQKLRKIYKEKRNSLFDTENLSLDIANKTLDLDIWNFQNYHVFFPIEKQKEVDSRLIIQIIQGKDKNVVLPKLNFESNSIDSVLLTDSTLLKTNHLGISEPLNGIQINNNQIDLVFVPLLAFDNSGHRVGYGGGYYDKFLSECPNAIKVGLSYFDPINKIEDINSKDIKLDYCITPKKVYEFSE
ncbi:MAG: 5-formyltetrahydrofolate cyclo-ligase [Flavobacteriaceae bacterium]|nr:5-formyltetrahydrofolate cyclo-ligase [Flavobacteriaceae bacterium]